MAIVKEQDILISNPLETQKGRIIRGIGGFYYVKIFGSQRIVEAKAKGLFRHQKTVPTVGDWVEISMGDQDGIWIINNIQVRKNLFVRPPVANVDIGLLVFSLKNPNPDLLLIDKLLLQSEIQNVEPIICFTKKDLVKQELIDELKEVYDKTPYQCIYLDQFDQASMDEIMAIFVGKTAFLAGPSGVGKSTMANFFFSKEVMETGALSEKLKRGKHTTRHVELLILNHDTYLLDTPGFSSYSIPRGIEAIDLKDYFPDFIKGACRFDSCIHHKEPGCAVKEAVEDNRISSLRYEHYLSFLEEIQQEERY